MEYRVCDGMNQCDNAFVYFTVTADFEMVAVDDHYTTNGATSVTIAPQANDLYNGTTLLALLATDADYDINVLSGPFHGGLTYTNGEPTSYMRSSPEDYVGVDYFEYRICYTAATATVCDTAVVTIDVNAAQLTAVMDDQWGTTITGQQIWLPVIENDTKGDSNYLLLQLVTAPLKGSITLVTSPASPDYHYYQSFMYVATTGGTDTFTYQICDLHGQCSEADVTIDNDF
jgi:hypothetical protein